MPAYATQQDFEAYVEGWVTDDVAALGRLLERASRDVDAALTAYVPETNGLKLGDLSTGANPKLLVPSDIVAVTRATCAQAEYRFTMGEDFFRKDEYEFVAGADFSRRGALSRLAPKARQELGIVGLLGIGIA
jgi:hypothetical protein